MLNLRSFATLVLALAAAGCAVEPRIRPTPPSVSPATQPAANFALNAADVHPMYQHLLAVDLPTVVRVATAHNLDIQQARQRYEAAKGQYESSVEAVFPVIAPGMAWTHFDGTNQNASGTLVAAAFNDFLPAVSIQWILNPGKVVYDIIAARRRLNASEDQTQAALLESERLAAVQYYDLVLAQAKVSAARQALAEGAELGRIATARLHAGTGLPVDELRAQTDLSRRQQELTAALNAFYQASVALTLTLHLDSSVTLVPHVDQINQTMLVRDDLTIDDLLALAARYRPDMQASQELVQALKADKNAVVWGGLGPQIQGGYSVGGIQTDNNDNTSAMHEQQRGNLGAGFALGLSTFGQAKVANAKVRLGALEAQRQADIIRAALVSAHQNSLMNAALVPLARQQLDSATEALRLSQANLNAGTLLTIDVLQAQDALEEARLRYVNAVVHYNQSQVNLLAALGLTQP